MIAKRLLLKMQETALNTAATSTDEEASALLHHTHFQHPAGKNALRGARENYCLMMRKDGVRRQFASYTQLSGTFPPLSEGSALSAES